MTNLHWNPGNVLFPIGHKTIRLYQPHYRRNILVHEAAIGFFNEMAATPQRGTSREELESKWNQDWAIADATEFSLLDHAYANSSMFKATLKLSQADQLSPSEAISLLLETGFMSASWPIKYDHEKKSFGQMFKGTFYEQIGTACLLERRQPTEWWTNQKFEADRKSTRENAYKYIQDRFLDDYLEKHVTGKTIIEVGCGTGYYTNRMAKFAKSAVGVDSNQDYIDIAKKTWGNGEGALKFGNLDIIDFSTDDPSLIKEAYDYVIMIDTFLFLFHESYQPQLYENRFKVIENLARLAHDEGSIITMDPHPLFLTPYFGDENRPFGILESYNTHYFRVIPTLSEMTDLLSEAGLVIKKVYEPKPVQEFKDVDLKAHNFYSEFPVWQVLELTKQ